METFRHDQIWIVFPLFELHAVGSNESDRDEADQGSTTLRKTASPLFLAFRTHSSQGAGFHIPRRVTRAFTWFNRSKIPICKLENELQDDFKVPSRAEKASSLQITLYTAV